MFKLFNKIFVLSLFCISINEIQAQSLSKEDVRKAINYFNCKLVETSLIKEEKSFTSFKEKCNCSNNPSFETIINSIDENITITLELSKEINEITKESIKDTADLIKRLTVTIFEENTKYQKVVKFAKDNSSVLPKIKTDLLTTYRQPSFFNYSPLSIESKGDGTITENTTKNEQTAESGWFSGFSSQMIVISLLLSFIVSLIFFLIGRNQLNKFDEQLDSEINKRRDLEKNNNNPVKNDKGTNDEFTILKKEIEKFDEKLAQLKSDLKNYIKELKINFEKSNEFIKTTEPNPVISPLSPPKDTNRTTFYLSMPEGEKTFSNQTKHSKFESGRSIYEAIEINSTKAKFRICNNQESINRAINNLDDCIKPVCDELNPPDGATKIITVTDGDGIIELQDNKWVVITKAKIRYER
jgi:hypothetical protein